MSTKKSISDIFSKYEEEDISPSSKKTKSASPSLIDSIISDVQKKYLPEEVESESTTMSSKTKEDPILLAILKQMDIKTKPKKHIMPKVIPQQIVIENKQYPSIPKDYKSSKYDLSTDQKTNLIMFLNTNPKMYEIEASLGTYSADRRRFYPGLRSIRYFNRLRWFLSNYVDSQPQVTEDIVDSIQNEYVRRVSTSDGVYFENKVRQQKINSYLWGIRFSKSYEKNITNYNFDEAWRQNVDIPRSNWTNSHHGRAKFLAVARKRNRISFSSSNKKNIFYGFKIELTTVNETRIYENRDDTRIKYEVEIERRKDLPANVVNLEKFMSVVQQILLWSQDATDVSQLIDLKEKQLAISLHNDLFAGDIMSRNWKSNDPYRLYFGYWNKPINIKLHNMIDPKFSPAVTVKLDGVRSGLLITENGIYLCAPPYNITKIGPGNKEMDGTFIDSEFIFVHDEGEIVEVGIYGFDILFYRGKDVRFEDFDSRIHYLKTIKLGLFGKIEYTNKKYYRKGSIYHRIRKGFKEAGKKYYQKYDLEDGLILQPMIFNSRYYNKTTYKWKTEEDMTIDFRLVAMSTDDIKNILNNNLQKYENKVYWTLVGIKDREIHFQGSERYPYGGYVILDDYLLNGRPLNGKVVECKWSSKNRQFVPYRFRDDRPKPNGLRTATDVWRDIMEPISKETMKGHTLRLMRKYHNREKESMLLAEFSKNNVILDIGSGRGGDLTKWKKVGFKKVYAIEPNKKNMKELRRRMEDMKTEINVTTLAFGAEKTTYIKASIDEKINGIVSFFSLTFFPQSKNMYNSLLDTISLIPVGGKFVGAVLDGHEVRRQLNKTREDENIPEGEASFIDTSSFSIAQVTEFDNNPIGNKIEINITDTTSMVKDQTEWLFYFTAFSKELKKRGFNLLKTGFLKNGPIFDKLPKDSKLFSSMNRYFVFERESEK